MDNLTAGDQPSGAVAFRLEAAHRLARYFDRHIARTLKKIIPQAVVGYENCTLETFETAKQLGILRILDVPSVHHRMQARVGLPVMRAKFQSDVNLRKDREIALADLILVCSSLARDSFVEAGVDANRIAILPLGVDLDRFYPERFPEDRPPSTVRFVFAGNVTAQKGVDTLVEACHELARNTIPFELVVAGSYADCERSLLEALRRYGQVIGRVPNGDLGDIYRQASCLVLPSRFDSFGQVVVEAMACGLPVIVSENVGARDLVESGKNGWVIPSKDVSALYQIMAECVSNPQKLRIMAKAARKTAERTGWPVYRDRAARTIRQFLEVNAQRREENEDLSRSGLLDLSHKSNGFGGTQMMEPSLPQRNADSKTNSDFKEVRHLFNRKATTWNQKYETGGSLAFRVSAFRELVAHELSPNNKVLDLGCGTGAIAAALSDGGLQVTACDVAEKMIDAGRRIYKAFPIQWCLLPPTGRSFHSSPVLFTDLLHRVSLNTCRTWMRFCLSVNGCSSQAEY